MANQPHTKGPWTFYRGVIGGHDLGVVLDYDIPGAGRPIVLASVWDEEDEEAGPGRIYPPEASANARLMAAAPDLLDACESAISALYDGVYAGSNEECVRLGLPYAMEVVRKLEAAVKKGTRIDG